MTPEWHDTHVPASEPDRVHGSVRCYAEVVAPDPRFEHVETVHSLEVLRRVG